MIDGLRVSRKAHGELEVADRRLPGQTPSPGLRRLVVVQENNLFTGILQFCRKQRADSARAQNVPTTVQLRPVPDSYR